MPKMIDSNQKTAFTNIAKLFRSVYAVPIRTKKDLMNYLGSASIPQAIQEGVLIYNNEVEKENALRAEEARIKRNEKAREKRKIPEYIMVIDLTFQCKKIIMVKEKGNYVLDMNKELDRELAKTGPFTDELNYMKKKVPELVVFEIKVQVKMKTTKPVVYFQNQIKKANALLKPFYDAVSLDDDENEDRKEIVILQLNIIFKELREKIIDVLRSSGVIACWIMKSKLTMLPIGTPQSIRLNPIREAGSINLDGLILNEVWCKNQGTCVPDWLSYKYNNTKGHIKSVKKYDIIEKLSTCEPDRQIYTNQPNKNGYTINNIELFCKNTHKTLIVLHNSRIIIYNQVLKCEDPLVVEIKNNHLYPITNTEKIRSLTHIGKSSSFHSEEKEQKIYEDIEYIQQSGNACDYILDTMIKLNVQTYGQKIRITNGHLHNFHLGNTLYSTSPFNADIQKYCEEKAIDYQGQPALSFLPEFIDKLPSSVMNIEIQTALSLHGVKHRTHYGAYNEDNDSKIISCDINKCYRFIMENPIDNFMTFDFTSTVEKSSFKNEFGLYYVKTDDMSILHGSNWYSNNMLQMAVDNSVDFKTLYFIKGIRQDKTILKNIIDEIKDCFSEDITKTLINSISGYLGKTESHSYSLEVDSDINRVWETIPENINDFFFQERTYDETKKLYLFGQKNTKTLLQNNLPMYIQILDWANMLMSKYILELGGFDNLLYRKTDAFIMKDVGIEPHFTDIIGGYKYNTPPIFIRTTEKRNVSYTHSPLKWNVLDEIKNSDDVEKINTHLQTKSLMIAARAGTGKSYIINKVNELNKCVKLSFTNKAATNIGGETIHKFLGIDDEGKYRLSFVLNKLKNIDLIILDEISMIDTTLWKILYEIKYMTGIRFLLCGDYRQLPPVDDDIECFNHTSIMFMCDEFRCELQYFEKCRYDKPLYDFLEDAWEERPISITIQDVKIGSHICFTNRKRKEINKLYNTKGELIPYMGSSNKYNEDIRVSEGVPLVCLHANKKLDMVKNELVVITKLTKESIFFGEKSMLKTDIHKYFMLGFAMTIHKSQGATIDGVLNIHEVNEIIKNKRMFYTAVSRATSLSNINYVA